MFHCEQQENCSMKFYRISISESLTEEDMSTVERFIIRLYDRTSTSMTVNDCRRNLFTKKGRSVESMPPTKDALMQHVKRAMLQSR